MNVVQKGRDKDTQEKQNNYFRYIIKILTGVLLHYFKNFQLLPFFSPFFLPHVCASCKHTRKKKHTESQTMRKEKQKKNRFLKIFLRFFFLALSSRRCVRKM